MTNKVTVDRFNTPVRNQSVALVLAGCGAKDGSEISEAVAALTSLTQAGFTVKIFAPDRPTHHVINHKTMSEAANESRNILTEAARIARGNIEPLENLSVHHFDAVCFPGGFGVAKNLCNFAFAGMDATLMPDVKNVLNAFISAKKPVAAMCIAPILIALAAREFSVTDATITLGADGSDAVKATLSWKVNHTPCATNEACVDTKNKFVSSPAYMYDDATPYDIWLSAQAMVKGLEQIL